MPLIRKDIAAQPPPASDPGRRPSEGSTQERWTAARALTAAADAPALIAALAVEADASVRQALLTSLARSGAPEAIDALIPLVRSDGAADRTAALDALRSMPAALAPRLADLLRDADPDVRLLACELARGAAPVLACSVLAERLEDDPEPNVCAAAVEVLAEVGTPAVLPALERCAARFAGDVFLRFAIAAAGERIRSQAPSARG